MVGQGRLCSTWLEDHGLPSIDQTLDMGHMQGPDLWLEVIALIYLEGVIQGEVWLAIKSMFQSCYWLDETVLTAIMVSSY